VNRPAKHQKPEERADSHGGLLASSVAACGSFLTDKRRDSYYGERGPVGGLRATPGGEEASDEVSIALAGAQRQARHVLKMGVVVTEPLFQRCDGAPALPWVRHAVVVEEADEGAQPLGRFGQVPVPVFGEAGAILVDEIAIDSLRV
jgi:hypothetical protein